MKEKRRMICLTKDCWERTANRKSHDYYEYTYCQEHGDRHKRVLKEMNEKFGKAMNKIMGRLS